MKWDFYRPDRDDECDADYMNIKIDDDYGSAAEYIVAACFDDWDFPTETTLRLRPYGGEWKTMTVAAETQPVFFAREQTA